MKTRKLKITPVLIALNICLLVLIAGFYLVRAVHYYLEENGKSSENDTTLLFEYIAKKQSYLDETKGLVYSEEENVYTYKGDVSDNYLYYSGIMFRVIGIDNENNVRAVSDKILTKMYSGLEKGMNDSYIRKWLNTNEKENSFTFMNILDSKDTLLAHTYACGDVIDDTSNIVCALHNNEDYVSLLSLYDYSLSGGQKGFLNSGESFYLSTVNSENENYIVNIDGSISLNDVSTRVFGVRPLITIDSSTVLLSGKGTKDNPYIIEKHDKNAISDVNAGEYIKLSNNNYKVINKNDIGVLVALDGAISDGEELVSKNFGSGNKYSTGKNTLGNYLNNDFYESLEEKDFITEGIWYTGQNNMSNLDYTLRYNEEVKANVGLLSLGDLFIHEVKNVFTLTRGIESDIVINVINDKGNLFGDLVASKYNVRPAFYLKNDLVIESGDGTSNNPYVLGGSDGEA